MAALPDTAWLGWYGDFGGAASPAEARRTVEAVRYLGGGDPAAASALLSESVAESLRDALSVFLLGEAGAALGDPVGALEQYEVLLRTAFRPHVRLAMGRPFEAAGG